MKTFQELKRNLKGEKSGLTVLRLALLGDHATQFLHQAIQGYGIEYSYDLHIHEADYNQIEAELNDPASDTHRHRPDFIIVAESTPQLLRQFYQTSLVNRVDFAETRLRKTRAYYEQIQTHSAAKLIYFNFPEIDDQVFGHFSNKTERSFLFQLRMLNAGLMRLATELSDLFICDISSLQNRWGRSFMHDPKLYIHAALAYHPDSMPHMAKAICDIITALEGQVNKCLILDLDNTIWGGIIGDDGMENIELGDLGVGKAFVDLQAWVLELKRRGVIVCVCSKNDEKTARQPFEKHPDMVLTLDDIAVFVANWNNKADNIRQIQGILNIGFDAMVFLDDSPFERNLVRQYLPEVTVPDLPEDPTDYLSFLRTLNLFETASCSINDEERTRQYRQETQRQEFAGQFTTPEEYLKGLEMICEVKAFDAFSIPRIAQLTQRSNQFNLRTIRYSEEDLHRIGHADNFRTYSFSLKDLYGDNGLVSALILEEKHPHAFFINTWIMSCRILKRGLELFVLNHLADAARKEGWTDLIGEYIPTPKNKLVQTHYHDLGFEEENGLWVLNMNKYTPKPTFIRNAKPGAY